MFSKLRSRSANKKAHQQQHLQPPQAPQDPTEYNPAQYITPHQYLPPAGPAGAFGPRLPPLSPGRPGVVPARQPSPMHGSAMRSPSPGLRSPSPFGGGGGSMGYATMDSYPTLDAYATMDSYTPLRSSTPIMMSDIMMEPIVLSQGGGLSNPYGNILSTMPSMATTMPTMLEAPRSYSPTPPMFDYGQSALQFQTPYMSTVPDMMHSGGAPPGMMDYTQQILQTAPPVMSTGCGPQMFDINQHILSSTAGSNLGGVILGGPQQQQQQGHPYTVEQHMVEIPHQGTVPQLQLQANQLQTNQLQNQLALGQPPPPMTSSTPQHHVQPQESNGLRQTDMRPGSPGRDSTRPSTPDELRQHELVVHSEQELDKLRHEVLQWKQLLADKQTQYQSDVIALRMQVHKTTEEIQSLKLQATEPTRENGDLKNQLRLLNDQSDQMRHQLDLATGEINRLRTHTDPNGQMGQGVIVSHQQQPQHVPMSVVQQAAVPRGQQQPIQLARLSPDIDVAAGEGGNGGRSTPDRLGVIDIPYQQQQQAWQQQQQQQLQQQQHQQPPTVGTGTGGIVGASNSSTGSVTIQSSLGSKSGSERSNNVPNKVFKARGEVKPAVGVQVLFVDDSTGRGQLCQVHNVVPMSPAFSAGILADDILCSWNGSSLDSREKLEQCVNGSKLGSIVTLDVARNKRSMQIPIRIAGTTRTDRSRGTDDVHTF